MTRSLPRYYLVTYDVMDDERRDRVAKKLRGYGDRVQYSVFWVVATPARMERLRAALSGLVNQRLDSVLICDLGLCPEDVQLIGRDRRVLPKGFRIL
jgi:CRISPR-associated protein Cas2